MEVIWSLLATTPKNTKAPKRCFEAYCGLDGKRRRYEGRWKKYSYEEILARDKTSLYLFWLRDDSMIDLDNLPEPDILAQEIVENIEAALESFRDVALKLEE